MNIPDFLAKDALLMKKEDIAKLIGPDREAFKELVNLSFNGKMPVSWRATWLMDYLAELYPWIADRYIAKIWSEIPENHPDGVIRSALRMLSRYDIPEDHQGIAADLCLNWLEKESVPVAIKAHSMQILLNIAKIYPELATEFKIVLQEQAPNNSVGFKARARMITEELNKLNPDE